jgi:DNA-binding transcriptional MerR regulator
MRLKKHYSSREVAALTGLSARQMRWWDVQRLVTPVIPSHRTQAGGFTERRYSPMDVYELMALAELRRRGFSARVIRRLLDVLRDRFGLRLYQAVWSGSLTLLTDDRDIYARTERGEFFNLLRAPDQPLLVLGVDEGLRELNERPRGRRRSRPRLKAQGSRLKARHGSGPSGD